MATRYDALTPRLTEFISNQPMFFVGTAARDGRVNVSPKGLDSLRVVNPTEVMWLNGTGSGNETAAHLLDAPRMTIMFCSHAREPLILRLYGVARTLHPADPDWDERYRRFPPMLGARNIFVLDIDLVQTSCGYGVPLMEFTGQRELMHGWATKKGEDGLRDYWLQKNSVSIDGFPTGMPSGDSPRSSRPT